MKALNPKFYRFENERGQTGDQFERDFIGQVDTHHPAYIKAHLEAIKAEEEAYRKGDWEKYKGPPTGGYLRIGESLKLARRFQPWSPIEPKKDFGKFIRRQVILLFEKHVFKRSATKEERERFKFYTAADQYKSENKNRYDSAKTNEEKKSVPLSPSDYFHGVDSWLEYTDETGKIFISTYDLTQNTEKSPKHVNDILVRQQELGDRNLPEKSDQFDDKIEEIAQRSLEKMLYRELLDKKIIL